METTPNTTTVTTILSPSQVQVIEKIALNAVATILQGTIAEANTLSPAFGTVITTVASVALNYVNGLQKTVAAVQEG